MVFVGIILGTGRQGSLFYVSFVAVYVYIFIILFDGTGDGIFGRIW